VGAYFFFLPLTSEETLNTLKKRYAFFKHLNYLNVSEGLIKKKKTEKFKYKRELVF